MDVNIIGVCRVAFDAAWKHCSFCFTELSTGKIDHFKVNVRVLGELLFRHPLGTLRFYVQNIVGPSLVRNLPCSTCVTSVPIH